jgi:hypothetical protein
MQTQWLESWLNIMQYTEEKPEELHGHVYGANPFESFCDIRIADMLYLPYEYVNCHIKLQGLLLWY